MGLPASLLTEDETLVLDLRPHWITLAPRAVMTAGAGISCVVASAYQGWFATGAKYLFGFLTLTALLFLGVSLLQWVTTNFAVTSERLIVRRGIIAKNGVEIPLDRINTVFFQQSILERVVGAGDLVIESASEQGRQTFSDVNNPTHVQQVIYRCREGLENSSRAKSAQAVASAIQPSPHQQSAVDELIKLKNLLDAGAITQEDYDRMKSKIVG